VRLLKSKHDKSVGGGPQGPGGPYAVFDSKLKCLKLSGQIALLGSYVYMFADISPTTFKFNAELNLLGFPFKVSAWRGISGSGQGSSITVKCEAGTKNGQGIMSKIKGKVIKSLDDMAKAGERAINEARAKVRRAKAKYLSQVNAVASKERDITAAQRDLDSVCGEEDNEQDENLQSIRVGHTQWLRQLEEGGKRQDELLASLQPAGLASPTEQADGQDVEAMLESISEVEEDKVEQDLAIKAKHRLVTRSKVRAKLANRWGVVRKAVKAVCHPCAVEAERLAREAAHAACQAAMAIPKGILEAAKYALRGLVALLRELKVVFDLAEVALQAALLANAAAFAILKNMMRIPIGVNYLMVQGTLRSNFLQSTISGHVKFFAGSSQFDLRATINLSDILGVVKRLFARIAQWFKDQFAGEEFFEQEIQTSFRTADVHKLHDVALAHAEQVLQPSPMEQKYNDMLSEAETLEHVASHEEI